MTDKYHFLGLSDEEDLPVLTDVADDEKHSFVMPNLVVNVSTVENLTFLEEGIPFSRISSKPIVFDEKSAHKPENIEKIVDVPMPENNSLETSPQEDLAQKETTLDKSFEHTLPFELLLVDEQDEAKEEETKEEETKEEETKEEETKEEESKEEETTTNIEHYKLEQDKLEQDKLEQDKLMRLSTSSSDALDDIKRRMASLTAKSILNSEGVTNVLPSAVRDESQKTKMAVLGEGALCDALYKSALPQIKTDVKIWLSSMISMYSEKISNEILCQFETDSEVIFGDTLHKNIRKTIAEARRSSVSNQTK